MLNLFKKFCLEIKSTIFSDDCCCNDTLDEVVPVTQTVNNITITDNALGITVGDVDVNTKLISLQVQTAAGVAVAGFFEINWWLADSAVQTAIRSLTTPTLPGTVEGKLVTDATGLATLTINHATLKTWYMNASTGVGVEISDAITVGS